MVSEVLVHPEDVIIHDPQQFYAGDDWEIEAICQNPDGTPMDLTGSLVVWLLNDSTGLLNLLKLTSEAGHGIEILPPTSGEPQNGHALISVHNAQTVLLPAGYYRDQLTVTTPGGLISTIWSGRIEVIAKLMDPVLVSGGSVSQQLDRLQQYQTVMTTERYRLPVYPSRLVGRRVIHPIR
jgi:hypothetical protein